MPTLADIIVEFHNSQPHPQAPNITVGEYSTAARLATLLKFGQGHATPLEVVEFWKRYQNLNQNLSLQKKSPIDPEEFQGLVQNLAKVSFAYHGRPPSIGEIVRLREAHPKDVTDFYGNLPDEHYPHVPAASMVKHLESARPWAQMYLDRQPTKSDASYFFHSGHSPQDYYAQLAKEEQGQQKQTPSEQPNA